MSLPSKIIFLLVLIISFSCKTDLEKQGWQRIPIVSQVNTSTVKKEKELVVQKIFYKNSSFYQFYISEKDSTGKIICREFSNGFYLNSDIAYYKLESDSSCLVKLFRQGDVQAYIKLGFGYISSYDVLYEPKKSQPEHQSSLGTAIVSLSDTSGIKNDKEFIVERIKLNGSNYHYNFTIDERDSAGNLVNKPAFGLERSFKSDMAYYKWESDSVCYIKLMSHGNLQASLKYIEYSDSSSSFVFLNEPKK